MTCSFTHDEKFCKKTREDLSTQTEPAPRLHSPVYFGVGGLRSVFRARIQDLILCCTRFVRPTESLVRDSRVARRERDGGLFGETRRVTATFRVVRAFWPVIFCT